LCFSRNAASALIFAAASSSGVLAAGCSPSAGLGGSAGSPGRFGFVFALTGRRDRLFDGAFAFLFGRRNGVVVLQRASSSG
jgi:hypothetical protein